MSILGNKFTVNDAADRFGKVPSRIRQICLQHEIGETVGNRIRVLSEKDMQRIGSIISANGRNRTRE